MPHPKYEFRITRNGEEYYCHYAGKQQELECIDIPEEVQTTFQLSPNILLCVFIFPDDREKSWASVYMGPFHHDITIPREACSFIYDY